MNRKDFSLIVGLTNTIEEGEVEMRKYFEVLASLMLEKQ